MKMRVEERSEDVFLKGSKGRNESRLKSRMICRQSHWLEPPWLFPTRGEGT